jgi:3-methyladenine DNA glycosylase/8-oxoguanine DNA glycosylase
MPVLTLPEPYDFHLSTERFRAFGVDRATAWSDGGLHRVVSGREVRLEAAAGGVAVDPLDDATEPVVRHLLGAPFDLPEFYAFAEAHDVLGPLLPSLRGLRPPLVPDAFEALVTSVTAQQVSLVAATAIRSRLVERYGCPGGRAYAFPTAGRLAAVQPADLLAVGLSRAKAEAICGLARAEAETGFLDLGGLGDAEVKARLTALPGIGEWTADWFLARHLARPRAWPAGDLGLRKAVAHFCLGGRMPSVHETRLFGAAFAPFENLSAQYLLVGLRIAPDGHGRNPV